MKILHQWFQHFLTRRLSSIGGGKVIPVNLSARSEMVSRRFVIWRNYDATGCSGTGKVAEGVVFPDGKVVAQWLPGTKGISTLHQYDRIEDIEELHGHGHNGLTFVEFVDY